MRVIIGSAENTPLGTIWLAVRAGQLIAVSIDRDKQIFLKNVQKLTNSTDIALDLQAIQPFATQIHAYLAGEQESFSLPIDWSVMTRGQAQILRVVDAIPYGKTRTYGEIAIELGMPHGAQAVGHANATNPMPLVIPCHRVLGAGNKLVGYNAPKGVETKAWLLQLEGRFPARQLRLF